MHTIITLFIVLFALTDAYARNNWNEPCISGVCHYGNFLIETLRKAHAPQT